MQYTLTFDNRVEGWTSFHSFLPDQMLGMNNKFFSFVGGNLFVHYSDTTGRNAYYGTQYPSKVSIMMNEAPSDIKVMKALSLEGNAPWSIKLTSFISSLEDFSQSSIEEAEFHKKEGKWYAYIRRNELESDLSSKSTYGIGEVETISVDGITYTFPTPLPYSVTVGDKIYKVTGELIGVVSEIVSATSFEITPEVIVVTPGTFIYGVKNARIEGGQMRGYTTRIDLTSNSSQRRDLFAVNAEIFKSYPS